MVVLRLHHGLKCGKKYNLSESKNFRSFKLFLWKNGIFAILWIGKNRYFAIFTIAKKKLVFVLLKLSKNAFFVQQKMDIFFYSNSLWVVVRIVEAAAVVLLSIVVWMMSFYREKTKKKLVTSNHIIINYYYSYCFYSVLVKTQRDHIQHYTRLAIKWACISVPIIASKLAGPSSFDWGNNWDWDTGSLFGNEKICP